MIDSHIKETRDLEYLHPELRERFLMAVADYSSQYPNEPSVFVTQTYRSPERQNELYAQGRTAPGRIVTWVKGGQSFHNMFPSLAVDVAFNIPAGKGGPYARVDLFEKFGAVGMKYDMEWGGTWGPQNLDLPHFQVPRYSIKDFQAGKPIEWKPLPNRVMVTGPVTFSRVFLVDKAGKASELELEKITIVGDKLYLKPRS